MSSPDRIETISVHIDPNNVPDIIDCLNCGPEAPIRKVLGRFTFSSTSVRIVNSEQVPYYVCGRCGLGELDENGEGYVLDADVVSTSLDGAILAKLVELDVDRSMQHALRESLAARERFNRLYRGRPYDLSLA